MSSESNCNFVNSFFNTAKVRDLVEKSLKQLKKENKLNPEHNQKSLEINTPTTSKVKMDSGNNQNIPKDHMDSKNIPRTPEIEIDSENVQKTPEIHKNILRMVRQSLGEEITSHLRMQKGIQEFGDKLDAFQNRIDNILEDLEFIKLLVLKANNQLDDSEQKKPGSSTCHL